MNKVVKTLAVVGSFGVLAGTPATRGAVIVTEIHYNGNGGETVPTEWIEIYNDGSETVDLSGWDWGDSQDGTFTGNFAAGTSLGAGKAAILVAQSPDTFAGIWGPGIQVIQTDIGPGLANGATATNELVVLRNANDEVVDAVNYENALNGWPDDNNQSSIYLKPGSLDVLSNDIGTNWGLSAVGVDGAYEAQTLNPDIANATLRDIASPGVVAVPEPAGLAIAGFAGLTLLARRRRAVRA